MYLEIIYLIYMYKKYLALNNLQWLIYHKIKLDQTKPNQYWVIAYFLQPGLEKITTQIYISRSIF